MGASARTAMQMPSEVHSPFISSLFQSPNSSSRAFAQLQISRCIMIKDAPAYAFKNKAISYSNCPRRKVAERRKQRFGILSGAPTPSLGGFVEKVTVSRRVSSIGLNGHLDLKKRLAEDERNTTTKAFQLISSASTRFEAVLKIVTSQILPWLRLRLEAGLKTLALSLLAASLAFFLSTDQAKAFGRTKEETKSTATVSPAQTPEKNSPPVDWGRSLPDENWPLEEREGLESDFLEHDRRDSQIDRAFETAETSDSDGYEIQSGASDGQRKSTEETGNHWEGDLFTYDKQLKEIKAEAERTKKKKAVVRNWSLRVAAIREGDPIEWAKMFATTQGKHVTLARKVVANHGDLLKKLAKEKEAKKLKKGALLSHEVVSIGGAWLKPAVQQGLLTPIQFAQQSEWWERLGSKWRRFVTRNNEGDLDRNGEVYAVPYRFGQIVIAYRADMLDIMGGPIEDWQDLFRPQLKGRIAMLGAPQEVVGIVLKSLGVSANARNFDREVPGGRQAVVDRYMQLRQQVRVFGDVQYAPALRNGDVLAAVGWAENFLPVTARMSSVKTITPASGTLLWADFWAVPAGSELTPVSQQWLDYCLQPERAKGLGAAKLGLSPLILPPFPESAIPGLPLHAQLASTSNREWRMEIANQDDPLTSEGGVGTGAVDARARFNGLYAPRMAVSAQVSGAGRGPFDKGITSGQLPRLEILEKSELLEPLDEQGRAEFSWLLSLVEETEKESGVDKIKRRWGEVAGRGGSVTD